MDFNQLNLKNELMQSINNLGYKTPTKVQKQAIPLVMTGKDIIAKSYTGSGKTAAFVLPILQQLNVNFKQVQTLIVCPTRELGYQILTQIKKYSSHLKGASATLLCGGSNIQKQIYSLKYSNIVVGTPGRLVDHLKRKTLKLKYLKTIVLDEADEMLKMGFKQEIDNIFSNIRSEEYQTLLFSATMNSQVLEIARNYQKSPERISIERSFEDLNNIEQYYFDARKLGKGQALISLFKKFNPKLSIVFSNTKVYTEKISQLLASNGIKSLVINGDKKQSERFKVMELFRLNKVSVLIATDVLARGIDVDGIDYVFNYDLPLQNESYIHRIGRTGRKNLKGQAITLVNSKKELLNLKHLEKVVKTKINNLYL